MQNIKKPKKLTEAQIEKIRSSYPVAAEKDEEARKQISAGWEDRLTAMANSEDHAPISRHAFCEKHDINKFMLLRYIKGSKLASWKTIDHINAALENEGF